MLAKTDPCPLPGPVATDRPLQEGDRILLDGQPGTVIGGGYEEGRGFMIDIKLDSGKTTFARSGSSFIQRVA